MIKRNCNNCGKEYLADPRNLKRGWGLSCDKSCAASLREKSKPSYNPKKVAMNNFKREIGYFGGGNAPNVVGGSGIITGYTSEGYRIMDGIAYDEWDDPVYNVGDVDEDERGWDSHK
jgi:hypothetical protein